MGCTYQPVFASRLVMQMPESSLNISTLIRHLPKSNLRL
jgi:hypothetical protein